MSTQVLTHRPYFLDKNFIPSLESGDRLTREEFHRRYEAMPEHVRAELINGVVFMASPVRVEYHGRPHAGMITCLGFYRAATSGVDLLDNATYIANDSYEPQPDCILRIDGSSGGKSWVNGDGYLEGSPEMVVEISSTTISNDLHEKYSLYEQKGVQEYIIWRVLDEQIDWFSLEDGKYHRLVADMHGIIESKVFPGLRLNTTAMVNDDLKLVLAELQAGLQSEKYAAFAKKLTK